MRKTTTARAIAMTAVAALSVAALASCSSDEPEAAPTESTSEIVIEDTMPTEDEVVIDETVTTGAVAAACAAYFELDLLNSAYAGGAVKDGDMTEKQVKNQMMSLITELNDQAQLAVDDGSGTARMAKNAQRMDKIVGGLKKKQDLKDLTRAKQKNFATASLRIQRACDGAGIPLPAENVTARTAAGIS